MRMEERIVLDGSVVAAVSAVAADSSAPAEAEQAAEHDDILPVDHADLIDNDTQTDETDNSTAGDGGDNDISDNTDIGDFLTEVLENPNNTGSELRAVIINTDIADSDDLIAAVADDVILITYSGSEDTLQSVIEQIDGVSDGLRFDSIAIAAHSNAGGELFLLDSEHVTAESLEIGDAEQVAFFSALGDYLTHDGRIDLISCYSGYGDAGEGLIAAIEGVSGRSVAASTDLTGSSGVHGDWILEKGEIDVEELYFNSDRLEEYSSTLQAPDQVLEAEANQFGMHVAADDNLMVVATDQAADGFRLYAYDGSSWVFRDTFSINNTCYLGTPYGVFDLEMDDNTFVVSIDGSCRDIVYVFEDIDDVSRSDLYESHILKSDNSQSSYYFGEDIDIDDNEIFATVRPDNSGTAGIAMFWKTGLVYGDGYHPNITFNLNAGDNSEIRFAADKHSVNGSTNIAVIRSGQHGMTVYSFDNTHTLLTPFNQLEFVPSEYGGICNSEAEFRTVRIQDDLIVAGIPDDYSAGDMTGMGAIAVYKGVNGVWASGSDSLVSVLVGNPDNMIMRAIGGSDLVLSSDGDSVFATVETQVPGGVTEYSVLAWYIADRIGNNGGVSILSHDRIFEGYHNEEKVNSIAVSSVSQLVTGSALAKTSPAADYNGIVESFFIGDYTPSSDVGVSHEYIPGKSGDGSSGSDDLGVVEFSFDSNIYLSMFAANMMIEFIDNSTNEPVSGLSITKAEAEAYLMEGNNRSIRFDLSDDKFDSLILGMQYTIKVPSGMFMTANGVVNPDIYTFTFITSVEKHMEPHDGNVSVNIENTTHISNVNQIMPGSGDNSDIAGVDSIGADEVSQLVDAILNDNQADLLSALNEILSEGDNADNLGDEGDNAVDNAGDGVSFSMAGGSTAMMIGNPFAEAISYSEVTALFNSSIQAFSNVGFGGSELFNTAQEAMGHTMTTAALVSNCEAIIHSIDLLLAEISDNGYDELGLSISGAGHTAAVMTVVDIIQSAKEDLIQARGNALIANDLLRILSIGINGFDDKIAQNSIDGGVRRLAESNEKLAYSYEVLNSILVAINSNTNGVNMTIEQMNDLLPDIKERARGCSMRISDSGDRASIDVLSFLTRQMNFDGINKSEIQVQIDMIFDKWHDSIGLSEPYDIGTDVNDEMAISDAENVIYSAM